MFFSAIRHVIWVSYFIVYFVRIEFRYFNAGTAQCRSCHK